MESWIESANTAETDFPLQNLPCGVFSSRGRPKSLGVAIGDQILDIRALSESDLITSPTLTAGRNPFLEEGWNAFMDLGPEVWAIFRENVTALLAARARPLPEYLVPMAEARLHMPFSVSEYTDFYSGRHHATNVGTMFRGPENALPPNWLHIPIGYNGRASSVVVSGTPVRRPMGQIKGPDDAAPSFGPSARFDIELEIGAIVGQPSDGPISVARAFDNIFGYVLLNDWSARDIQAWEYQPLGPFQSKATATTISPWIVTAAALEPFRVPTPKREVPLLPYLEEPGPMLYDIDLQVVLKPAARAETIICRTNYREMYYSAAQQLAHHTSCGCPIRVGDLLGSGTISGPNRDSCGSLLELSWGGKEPIEVAGGTRTFLQDGDTVTLRGHAQGDGYRIGFGDCAGKILPASEIPG